MAFGLISGEKRIEPEVGFSSPMMVLMSVVLPEPLGPTTHRKSPASISKLRFFITALLLR